MDPDDRLEVRMELEGRGGSHLSGRLALDGDVKEFSGWLSLMALLEGLRRDAGRSRAPPPGGADPFRTAEPDESLAGRGSQQNPQHEMHINHQEG